MRLELDSLIFIRTLFDTQLLKANCTVRVSKHHCSQKISTHPPWWVGAVHTHFRLT